MGNFLLIIPYQSLKLYVVYYVLTLCFINPNSLIDRLSKEKKKNEFHHFRMDLLDVLQYIRIILRKFMIFSIISISVFSFVYLILYYYLNKFIRFSSFVSSSPWLLSFSFILFYYRNSMWFIFIGFVFLIN